VKLIQKCLLCGEVHDVLEHIVSVKLLHFKNEAEMEAYARRELAQGAEDYEQGRLDGG
jgi:hypothetical protein